MEELLQMWKGRVPSGGSNYSKTTRAKACVEILEMSLYFTGNHLYWYRQLKTNEKNTTKKKQTHKNPKLNVQT